MMPQKGQLKAVLFDLGGTLVKISQIPHVMKKVLSYHGISHSLEEITSAWKKAEKGLDFKLLPKLLDEFWVRWNKRILAHLGIQSDNQALAEFITTHWWDYSDITLYPDAKTVLPLLKRTGLKIGLVTNGLQSDIDKILPRVDLQDFFDIIVMINTLGKMKPDAELFHYALNKLRAAPSEAIFIGDEMESDYKGAQMAGLTAYLIDRKGKNRNKNVNTIISLNDLRKLNIFKK
jgi:HAD superfamily hydrolase (TIGR01549 family)